jgi:hypothetical protein
VRVAPPPAPSTADGLLHEIKLPPLHAPGADVGGGRRRSVVSLPPIASLVDGRGQGGCDDSAAVLRRLRTMSDDDDDDDGGVVGPLKDAYDSPRANYA